MLPETNLERRVALHQGLERLDRARMTLSGSLADKGEIYAAWWWRPPAWVLPAGDDVSALRERARHTIARIEYEPGEERRKRNPSPEESRQLGEQYLRYDLAPGLVAASPRLLELARTLNTEKAALAPLIEAMNRPDCKVGPADDRTGEHLGEPFLRFVLRALGRSSLNLHRIKRQILILEEAPISVGFTWASPRRITTISLEDLRNQLVRLRGAREGDGLVEADFRILEDLERRAATEGQEVPLARINASHTHPKANIRLADGSAICRQAVLPILYPGRPGQPLVNAGVLGHWPHDEQARPFLVARRRQRSDVVYEPERPLLQSLPIYSTAEELKRYRGALP